MGIDRSLLNEFVKITNDKKETKQTQLYGTVVTQGNSKYVKIDGSEIITPVRSTTDIKDDERVIVKIDNHMATITGNMTNPSVGNDRVEFTEGKIDRFDHLFAGNITAENIAANSITSDKILAGSITTDKLMAESIIADKIAADAIESRHIKADAITADKIDAGIITSDHISSGTITADKIATGTITAGSGIIAEGAIGSAQISSLDVAKLESGTIDTSKIYIAGADGHLQLKGNRLQVFDGLGNKAIERVSVGDVNGDGSKFGLRVRGADGETILLDENGVTSEGITDGSITNNKISDDANIDGAKLNINSIVSKINEDGTETIQGTKIEVDGTTLNTKLSTITNKQTEDGERITQAQSQIYANTNAIKLKVDEQTYTTDKKDMTSKLEKNTSEISTMKGQIALKVEQSDIESAKSEMKEVIDTKVNSAKAEIKITTDAISQNISNLTQTVSNKADGSTVSSLNSKVSSLETSLNGITSRVGTVETNQTTVNGKVSSLETRMSTAESKITESAITNTVKKNFYTKSETDSQITSKGYQTESQVQQTVNGLEVKVQESGGYNLIYNGDFKRDLNNWNISGDTSKVLISSTLSCSANQKGVRIEGTLKNAIWVHQSVPWDSNDPITLSYWQHTTATGSDGTTNPFRATQVVISYTDGTTSWHTNSGQSKYNTWEKISHTITPDSGKRVRSVQVDLWCRDTTKMVYYTNVMLEKGSLATEYTPNPNEIYAGITTIDKEGITVKQSNISTYTTMDASSFRVENNTGGTVAEFSQNSQIPNLTAGVINADEIYANNIVRKSSRVKNYYVAGVYGNDVPGAGDNWNNPFKTVQYVLDNYVEDILDYDVNIYVGQSVPGWTCKSKSGKGVISFLIQDDCIVRDPLYLDNCTNHIIVQGSSEKKGTFMTGIVVIGCRNFDVGWVSFRGKNWAHPKGSCNILVKNSSKGIIRFNDFNGCSFAIIVENNSEIWLYQNRGSDITHYIGIGAYATIYGMRSGSDVCPDFTSHYYADAGHANLYHIHDGASYSKTPSIGWAPSYTPSQKTQTWSFNKIWSDETLHGWSDRQELIQGYASTWNTGRWTGYIQMTDDFAAIRNTISGGTNLSGRIYIQRTSSSGNSTGSKLCLYGSDGTLITNSTSINRSQGVWVSLSSSIIQKIQSGAIRYFYLKADANNSSTYFKCERNCKIEITYTK